jgi:hypothetical protein
VVGFAASRFHNKENAMRNRIFAVAAAVMVGVAATTTGAVALDQGAGFTKRSGHSARVAWRGDRYAWGVNGRGLPFGPPVGALYSYGSRHACNPYDPFTALYGYCGGPYHYDGW